MSSKTNRNMQKKSRTARRRVRNPGKGQPLSVHPPQISGYEISHKKRMRFTVVAATGVQTITFQNLLDTILLLDTAIHAFDVFDLVRISFVEVWAQGALGTPTSIVVDFATATGDRSMHTDTSLGVSPAYVKAVPSPKSLASFFQVSAAGAAFTITCPAGSVVDVSLSFRTSDQVAPVAAANAVVGGAVGQIQYRGLDGLAIAATNFPPPVGVGAV